MEETSRDQGVRADRRQVQYRTNGSGYANGRAVEGPLIAIDPFISSTADGPIAHVSLSEVRTGKFLGKVLAHLAIPGFFNSSRSARTRWLRAGESRRKVTATAERMNQHCGTERGGDGPFRRPVVNESRVCHLTSF